MCLPVACPITIQTDQLRAEAQHVWISTMASAYRGHCGLPEYRMGHNSPQVTVQDTFQVQFVINDDVSGMVDNNRNSDFQLPLLNPPTEDEVIESRAEKMKSWERRIRQVCFLLMRVVFLHRDSLHSSHCWTPQAAQAHEATSSLSIFWQILRDWNTWVVQCLAL